MAVIPMGSLPLGFRFHPTDEELVNHYLKRKIDGRIDSDAVSVVPEVDVLRCEPWELPERAAIRSPDPEWFFFSPRDVRKYPSGSRHNRATEAGYWKATGKDRLIKSSDCRKSLIGMKKTLVFYCGRAPRAARTGWIMHEYRTAEPEFESGRKGSFVLCRLFKKPEESQSPNTDEVGSGFSPTPIGSSPSDVQHGRDALEELATPTNQESPERNLQESSQPSSPITADHQPARASHLVEEVDRSTSYSLKPEESLCNSNMASDVLDHEAKVVAAEDEVEKFSGSKFDPFDFCIPYNSPPLQHTDFQYCGNFGLDQLSPMALFEDPDAGENDFLDTVLNNQGEDFSEFRNVQKDSNVKVVPEGLICEVPHASLWDSIAFKEAALTQDGLGLISLEASSSNDIPHNYPYYHDNLNSEAIYGGYKPCMQDQATLTSLCSHGNMHQVSASWKVPTAPLYPNESVPSHEPYHIMEKPNSLHIPRVLDVHTQEQARPSSAPLHEDIKQPHASLLELPTGSSDLVGNEPSHEPSTSHHKFSGSKPSGNFVNTRFDSTCNGDLSNVGINQRARQGQYFSPDDFAAHQGIVRRRLHLQKTENESQSNNHEEHAVRDSREAEELDKHRIAEESEASNPDQYDLEEFFDQDDKNPAALKTTLFESQCTLRSHRRTVNDSELEVKPESLHPEKPRAPLVNLIKTVVLLLMILLLMSFMVMICDK